MSLHVTPNVVAGGNILPSTFVKLSSSADFTVLQAGANDSIYGISQVGAESGIGGIMGDSTYAGTVGWPMQVFGNGTYALLKAGTGGWSRNQFLKSDANGSGVPATIAADAYGARSLTAASAGDYRVVEVIIGQVRNVTESYTTVTTATTFTASDTGKSVFVGAADLTITMPPVFAGGTFRFVLLTSGLSTGTGLLIATTGTDKVIGNGFTSAAGKGALLSGSTDREGDAITLISDGTVWAILNYTGTWTRQA